MSLTSAVIETARNIWLAIVLLCAITGLLVTLGRLALALWGWE